MKSNRLVDREKIYTRILKESKFQSSGSFIFLPE